MLIADHHHWCLCLSKWDKTLLTIVLGCTPSVMIGSFLIWSILPHLVTDEQIVTSSLPQLTVTTLCLHQLRLAKLKLIWSSSHPSNTHTHSTCASLARLNVTPMRLWMTKLWWHSLRKWGTNRHLSTIDICLLFSNGDEISLFQTLADYLSTLSSCRAIKWVWTHHQRSGSLFPNNCKRDWMVT